MIELAVPLLEEAAVAGSVRSWGTRVSVSTLPRRVSQWLRLDLPARVERLGVPVTIVTPAPSVRAWES